MDIIASMLAYVVCMTGLVTGLVMSFAVFFSAPSEQAPTPTRSIAMMVKPSSSDTEQASPAETIAPRPAVAAARQAPVAQDAQQKPLFSPRHMRQLAQRDRERHVAYRERSSFEARFLHYDD